MKRIILALAALALGTGIGQSQILYRISGNGLEKPSYVIGTYHLAPVSFVDSIAGLQQALADCAQVYGELDMQDMLSPENAQKMMAAQTLPEGTTLRGLLGKERTARFNALMREVMGVDLDNEAVAAQMDGFSPAAISTTLFMVVCMQKTQGFNPANLFDSYFQQVALQSGKPARGFETVDFQLQVLYGTPLEQQADELMCTVDHFQDAIDAIDFMLAAFFAQDLDQLAELVDEEDEGPCPSDPEQSRALLADRNNNWLAQMPAIMAEQPTFFAVGAAHLVGDEGLLRQLQAKGYKVEGVR